MVQSYADLAGLVTVLRETLDELTGKMKVSPDEIVVLSPYRWDSERLGIREFVEKHGEILSTDLVTRGQGKIRIGFRSAPLQVRRDDGRRNSGRGCPAGCSLLIPR